MKNKLLYIAFGVICGLLGGGIVFLAGQSPRGNAIQLSPPPTPRLWVVQISGAVVHSGVYELPAGSRVRDAVQAAGGLSPEASSTVDLASLLSDGQLIFISSDTSPATPSERSNLLSITLEPGSLQGASTPAGLININTATLEELDKLPDIGPVIAQRIIDYRTLHGPFVTIEGIMDVQGIGDVMFAKIKNLITVEP